MNILVFTPYPSMVGGANRSLLMVLKGLKNQYQHQLLVVVPKEGVFSQALDENGIEWMSLPIHEIGGVYGLSPRNLVRLAKNNLLAIKDRRTAKKFAKLLDRKFDLVYINDNSAYIGSFAAKALGLPYVWHFRTLLKPGATYVCGGKEIFGNCQRIIAISDGMKELIVQNKYMPAQRVVRIHNGIPVEPLERSPQSRENGFHFVICGRITEDKGHLDAVRALGALKQQGISDIYLHIVGAIPPAPNAYVDAISQLGKELEVEDQVIFEGTRNDMPVFRKGMNGELMCSVCEPFGRVTLEGMRSGLVVIGSNTGGTPEIIQDGYSGLLYQQGDPMDLAEKIKLVYENEEYAGKLADQAFEYGNSHFTPEKNVSAINEVLLLAANKN